MKLTIHHTIDLLEDVLCPKSKSKREDLVEAIEHTLDSLYQIQDEYVLLQRSAITETREI